MGDAASGRTKVARTRALVLDSSPTFRDLGGYPTAAGGTTRVGMVFRSAALADVSGLDGATVSGLGLRAVIDLRAAFEVASAGRTIFEELGVPRLHVPILDSADAPAYVRLLRRHLVQPDGTYSDLASLYRIMLDTSGAAFARAFSLVTTRTPAAFLCTAGKDRSGLLAALVLRMAGVDDALIAMDYADSAPDGDCDPIVRALEHLDRRWGGAGGYLLAHGVTQGALRAFQADFVSPADDDMPVVVRRRYVVVPGPDETELAAG